MLQANVADSVHRVEDAYTNWYLLEEDGQLTIVDCGVRASWQSLEDTLKELSRSKDQIAAIVLTHAHFDHIGFAERGRRELGVPVWVHENDVPLTRHPMQYAHERSRAYYFTTQVKAMPIFAKLVRSGALFPTPIAAVSRYEGGTLPVPGSPHAVFTPGHTMGHCSLHLPDRDVVIAGDALVTLNPYRGTTGPQIVSGAATADSARNLRSLDGLLETGARTLLCGHGEPWRDGVESAVTQARQAGPS